MDIWVPRGKCWNDFCVWKSGSGFNAKSGVSLFAGHRAVNVCWSCNWTLYRGLDVLVVVSLWRNRRTDWVGLVVMAYFGRSLWLADVLWVCFYWPVLSGLVIVSGGVCGWGGVGGWTLHIVLHPWTHSSSMLKAFLLNCMKTVEGVEIAVYFFTRIWKGEKKGQLYAWKQLCAPFRWRNDALLKTTTITTNYFIYTLKLWRCSVLTLYL